MKFSIIVKEKQTSNLNKQKIGFSFGPLIHLFSKYNRECQGIIN